MYKIADQKLNLFTIQIHLKKTYLCIFIFKNISTYKSNFCDLSIPYSFNCVCCQLDLISIFFFLSLAKKSSFREKGKKMFEGKENRRLQSGIGNQFAKWTDYHREAGIYSLFQYAAQKTDLEPIAKAIGTITHAG